MLTSAPYLLPSLNIQDNERTFHEKYELSLKTMIPVRIGAKQVAFVCTLKNRNKICRIVEIALTMLL